jgi:signal transduction histidine kinase
LELKGIELIIKIEDSGIGISEEVKKLVFQPFRQAGISNKKYGGNGLGLSLVKAYTELLKGSVSFESELGKGSTFVVSILIKE